MDSRSSMMGSGRAMLHLLLHLFLSKEKKEPLFFLFPLFRSLFPIFLFEEESGPHAPKERKVL